MVWCTALPEEASNSTILGSMKHRGWILAVVLVTGVAAALLYRSTWAGNDLPVRHSVTLNWTPAAGATSYNVYRSDTKGGPYVKIGTTTGPPFVNSPVPNGTVVYYVVTSVGYKGESKYSKEVAAVIP